MKIVERKQAILAVMIRFERPIWLGDVSKTASDQGSFRSAFRALIDEGKIVADRRSRAGRVYYRMADAPAPQELRFPSPTIEQPPREGR
jgi:hypothetical protein